jgi:hypothetical protein
VDWIHLSQDRVRVGGCDTTGINLRTRSRTAFISTPSVVKTPVTINFEPDVTYFQTKEIRLAICTIWFKINENLRITSVWK